LKLEGKLDREKDFIEYVENRSFNDMRYLVDTAKLNDLGWIPTINFETGLKHTISWYKAHKSHFGDITHALVAHPRIGLNDDFIFSF